MAIKSFDEYFKENRRNFFQDMKLNNRVLANAKIVLEEFKTSKEVHLWLYKHYQGTPEEKQSVNDFDDKMLEGLITGSMLVAIRDAAVEYATYYEKENQSENNAQRPLAEFAQMPQEAHKELKKASEKVVASQNGPQAPDAHQPSGHPSVEELSDIVRQKLGKKTEIPHKNDTTPKEQTQENTKSTKLTPQEIKEYRTNQKV